MKICKIAVAGALCLLPVSAALANGQKAIYEKYDGANVGARVTFQYKDDSMFHVNTKPGFVTDIQLRDGEELTYVAGGDTKSWLIDKAKVGSVQHVYIKPLEPGKHTNIIINTDMHTYRFDVWSGMEEYDPLITFRFPEDIREGRQGNKSFVPPRFGMNRDYEIKAKRQDKYAELIPSTIMDDGKRTYIKVPATNRYDMPVLYMVNPWDKKQTLVNYRVRDGYFVADVVMEHGRLVFHQKYGIDFYNKAKAGMGKSMRQRVEEIRAEEGEDEPFLAPPKVIPPPNPVEDEVYTVPEGAEVQRVREVRKREPRPAVKKEAPRKEALRAEEPQERQPRPVGRKPAKEAVSPVDTVQAAPGPVEGTVQPMPSTADYPAAWSIPEEVARQAAAMVGNDYVAPAPQQEPARPAQEAQAVQPAPQQGALRGFAVVLDNGQVANVSVQEFNSLDTKLKENLIRAGRVKALRADG